MENINNPHTPIKQWAQDDRPREKMIQKGADSLSLAELLAILIQNGTRSKSALDLARELLQASNQSIAALARKSLKDLQKVKGIGPAKAVMIKAALQLTLLKEQEKLSPDYIIKSSGDIVGYLRQRLADEPREIFMAIFLNKRLQVLQTEVLSMGGISGTVVDARLLMRKALELHAVSIILAHNHPSGN
ncbi:MAG TPA: DNA repair protein RadC, partial [Phnomibacter sp.]|nr:DNA repair protein RadC [Phnomibacter sp.]